MRRAGMVALLLAAAWYLSDLPPYRCYHWSDNPPVHRSVDDDGELIEWTEADFAYRSWTPCE